MFTSKVLVAGVVRGPLISWIACHAQLADSLVIGRLLALYSWHSAVLIAHNHVTVVAAGSLAVTFHYILTL